MFRKINISIPSLIENNRHLFEKVSDNYMNMKNIHDVQYNILNYEKILNDMCEFVEGYTSYSADDENDKYKDKVLSITRNFYNSMFTDIKKYRKNNIVLREFQDINIAFLEGSKRLKEMLETLSNSDNLSCEMESLIFLTDNQYKKLNKVHRDDMKIYLWLSSSNSSVFKYEIDSSLRKAFNDKTSPVIHKMPKTAKFNN